MATVLGGPALQLLAAADHRGEVDDAGVGVIEHHPAEVVGLADGDRGPGIHEEVAQPAMAVPARIPVLTVLPGWIDRVGDDRVPGAIEGHILQPAAHVAIGPRVVDGRPGRGHDRLAAEASEVLTRGAIETAAVDLGEIDARHVVVRVPVGKGQGDAVAAVGGHLGVRPATREVDQHVRWTPLARVRPGGEARLPVAAAPEEVVAIGLGRQDDRVGIGEPPAPRRVGGQIPPMTPRADVSGMECGLVVEAGAVVHRPVHGDAVVGLDRDRGAVVIVGVVVGDLGLAGAAMSVDRLDHDLAGGGQPADDDLVDPAAVDVHRARVGKPTPGAGPDDDLGRAYALRRSTGRGRGDGSRDGSGGAAPGPRHHPGAGHAQCHQHSQADDDERASPAPRPAAPRTQPRTGAWHTRPRAGFGAVIDLKPSCPVSRVAPSASTPPRRQRSLSAASRGRVILVTLAALASAVGSGCGAGDRAAAHASVRPPSAAHAPARSRACLSRVPSSAADQPRARRRRCPSER